MIELFAAVLIGSVVWFCLYDWIGQKCRCRQWFQRIGAPYTRGKHRRECPYYVLDEMAERLAGRR